MSTHPAETAATTAEPRPLFTDYRGAAHMLGVSVSHAKRAVADGTIPHRKVGRRVLIPVAGLEALAAETIEGPA